MPRIVSVVFVLVLLSLASVASAQRRNPRPPRTPTPAQPAADGVPATPRVTLADLPQIAPRLQSANPDEVREAIDLLVVMDRPEVVPHLAALLRRGQADAVTDRALEALAGIGHPSGIEILLEFTHHRRAGARLRAYRALAAIRDPRMPPLVEQGLRDSDRTVRAAVAISLGDIGARSSIDTLFRAFERGVVEAAMSIGKLGDGAALTRFTSHLGQQPLSVMLSGYDQFVRRADISSEAKLQIVARLGEVAGPQVRRFLVDYLGTQPEGDRGPDHGAIRRALEETIRRIPANAAAPARPAAAAPAAAGGAR